MEGYQRSYEEAESIASFLLKRINVKPKIGVICGSGLGGLANTIDHKHCVDYSEIPNFPQSSVVGHAGRWVSGSIQGKPCIVMQGRFHLYEGFTTAQVTLPVRVMKLMGVEVLLVTNAAGGLNPEYKAGDLMIIRDHIYLPGLVGHNPLVGSNDERFGTRFPAMSEAYSTDLRQLARDAARYLGLNTRVREGTYFMLGGPSYETIAECRMLRAMGADAVGMSTCPEVVVAVHCGMKVLGLSIISNECVMSYDEMRKANHEEVLRTGCRIESDCQSLISKIIELITLSTCQ